MKPESRVDMPRLFIAIDFPEYVSAKLQDIAYGMPGAVWVPSHQYHLTLRFLGEQNESTLEYVRHALNDVHVDSFHIDLKGVGHFPLRGDPEVLWVGVAANEALLRLSRKLESALGRAGVQPDGRKFHPHVTLARLKNDALLIFSVGGGDAARNVSINLIRAIELAKARGARVLGIVGRSTGYTALNGDVVVVIPEVNPGRVTPLSEGFQGIVWHCLVSHPILQQVKTKW